MFDILPHPYIHQIISVLKKVYVNKIITRFLWSWVQIQYLMQKVGWQLILWVAIESCFALLIPHSSSWPSLPIYQGSVPALYYTSLYSLVVRLGPAEVVNDLGVQTLDSGVFAENLADPAWIRVECWTRGLNVGLLLNVVTLRVQIPDPDYVKGMWTLTMSLLNPQFTGFKQVGVLMGL